MSNPEMRQAIKDAIGAHGAWKMKLKTAVLTGRSEISSDVAKCDDKCAFGKWLYSTGIDDATRAGKPYQVVRRLHAEFHTAAGGVLQASERGDRQSAASLLDGAFAHRSDTLKTALVKWLGEVS